MKTLHFILLFILSVFLLLSCGTESTPIYTLTTSVNGEGTVTPSSGEFEEGETVTITSNASNGWLFERWSGDESEVSNTLTITMDSDKNVIGNFQRKDYPLTVTIEGEGSVNERIISSPKTTQHSFETVIELSPTPSDGWIFVEWSGDLSGKSFPQQITITEEKNVTAIFSPVVFLSENEKTIMCPYGEIGEIGIVNGVEYEIVNRELLLQRIEEGKGNLERNVCVTHVTDMSSIFNSSPFNQPIGDWDVSNVNDMSSMFAGSSFNQPIGNWDVSNVERMFNMFILSEFNQPIGDWDVGNVFVMINMFNNSPFNQPIGDWDVSNVTRMEAMFNNSSFNQPIGNWSVDKVTDMGSLFSNSPFNQPIDDWNISNVKNMENMFNNSPFNQPIGDWDVSNVERMYGMFDNTPFNQPIGDWDVGNVRIMNSMFNNSEFNQDISRWCVWRIESEPSYFSSGSPLTEENKPVWGTCPD